MAQQILTAAGYISALSLIGAATLRAVRFFLTQSRQEKEIAAIKAELRVVCNGIFACLDGLKQMGCAGRVADAEDDLERHLNESAHK